MKEEYVQSRLDRRDKDCNRSRTEAINLSISDNMRPGSPVAAFYPQVQPIQLATAGLESSWHSSLFIAPDRSSTQISVVDDEDCHDTIVSKGRAVSTGSQIAMDAILKSERGFDRALSVSLLMPNGRRADQAAVLSAEK